MIKYVDYLVMWGDGEYSYRSVYVDAQALAAEHENAKIYGAAYLPSGIDGLLQRQWCLIAH